MQVKLIKMLQEHDHDGEFLDGDIRAGVVTCASLSRDGCRIALGFGNGAIEIVDVNRGLTVYLVKTAVTAG